MPNALFAFDDTQAARRAAERAAQHLSPDAVVVHAHDSGRSESLLAQADETLISGGMLRSLYELFQSIFEWSGSPHDAAHYAEVVRHGGAVVSVDAVNSEQQSCVDSVMRDSGCGQRTDWSDLPVIDAPARRP